MTKRVAVIDCGTNTFNLLIADISSEPEWKRVFQISIPVKLTPPGPNKSISLSRIARALDALYNFKQNIINFRVDKVAAFATDAFRVSENGEFLREAARKKTGIEIEIISGENEATLIYQGVKISGILDEDISIIMDIGGGSTEFILATKDELKWKGSFPIGVSRIYNRFDPENPMTKKDIQTINQYLFETCGTLLEKIREFPPKRLIGTAGSFNSLVSLLHSRENTLPRLFRNNQVEKSDFNKLYDILVNSKLEERLVMSGLRPYRAPFIPIAVIKVKFILEHTGIDEIFQTPNALKEGVLLNLQREIRVE